MGYALWSLIVLLVFGLALVVMVFWRTGSATGAILWAMAYHLCGAGIGFLFGIPKVLQSDGVAPNGGSQTATNAPSSTYHQRVNTNLEQISDWLTKIIVGISLVELRQFPYLLDRATRNVSIGFPLMPTSYSFAEGLILYFSVTGFLGGYILTRSYLARLFALWETGTQLKLDPQQRKALELAQPSAPGNFTLTGLATQAAKQLLGVNVNTLQSVDDIALWAKAHVGNGEAEQALPAYEKILLVRPDDVQIRLDYATALESAGKPYNKIAQQLLMAKSSLLPTTDLTLKDRLYKWLTFCFLYIAPPEGFSRAIQYGKEYLSDPRNSPSAEMLINLACAYGQMFKSASPSDAGAEKIKSEARDEALKYLKRAIGVDPNAIVRLRQLLQKGAWKDPKDNDLEVFENDPDFRSALGLAAVQAPPSAG